MKNKIVALIYSYGNVSYFDGSEKVFKHIDLPICSLAHGKILEERLFYLTAVAGAKSTALQKVEFKLEVRRVSPIVGFGVFAGELIPKGTFLGNYVGEVIPYEAVENNRYLFGILPHKSGIHGGVCVTAHEWGNHTRFVNHSSTPNVHAYTRVFNGWAETYFVAKEDILPGEQLLIDYGPDYWVDKPDQTEVGL